MNSPPNCRRTYTLFLLVLFVCFGTCSSHGERPDGSKSAHFRAAPTEKKTESNGAFHATLPEKNKTYEILEESLGYKRWRTITQRSIRIPSGRIVDFDLVGLAGASSAVLVFAWDSRSKTATLVREYHPGSHCFLHGVAAGIVEDDKHDGNPHVAARHELEEECHLSGGQWYLLTPEPIAMDKYTTTKAVAFLVVDANHVEDPRPQDDEEDIEIITGVTVQDIMDMIRKGEMNLVGIWGCLMALQKLRELGEID